MSTAPFFTSGWPIFGGLVLSGCIATDISLPSRGAVASGPPPPVVAEARPAPPEANALWVAGYWHWNRTKYIWVPGHWEAVGGLAD